MALFSFCFLAVANQTLAIAEKQESTQNAPVRKKRLLPKKPEKTYRVRIPAPKRLSWLDKLSLEVDRSRRYSYRTVQNYVIKTRKINPNARYMEYEVSLPSYDTHDDCVPFSKIMRVALKSSAIKAFRDAETRSVSAYLSRRILVFIPVLECNGVMSFLGGFDPWKHQPYAYSLIENQQAERRSTSAKLKLDLCDLINVGLEGPEQSASLGLSSATRFDEEVKLHAKVFVLLASIRSQAELCQTYRDVVESYSMACAVMAEKIKFGDIQNESGYNQPTFAQLTALHAEAQTKLIEAEKKYGIGCNELRLIIGNMKVDPRKVDLNVPALRTKVNLDELIESFPGLRQAYLQVASAKVANRKHQVTPFLRDASVSISVIRNSLRSPQYYYWYSPFDWMAEASFAVRISMADFVVRRQRESAVNKAEGEYLAASVKAYEHAKDWLLAAKNSMKSLEAQRLSVEENRKEMLRYKAMLALDPRDEIALYKFGEAASRYAESLVRADQMLATVADIYFRLSLKRPIGLQMGVGWIKERGSKQARRFQWA